MERTTTVGMNRTGIGMAPLLKDKMIEGAEQGRPSRQGDGHDIEMLRHSYISGAPTVGSIPPPTSVKGALKAGMQALKGTSSSVLLNKLGERLAFERTGTRLYEALIAKFNGQSVWQGGPTRADLEQFHDEEMRHFELLRDAVESLGGDPTVVTPAADVMGVASEGLIKVASDPRMTLPESLGAILVAELADNEGWKMLIQLSQEMGQTQLVTQFETAMAEEDRHLSSVRYWLTSAVKEEAHG